MPSALYPYSYMGNYITFRMSSNDKMKRKTTVLLLNHNNPRAEGNGSILDGG